MCEYCGCQSLTAIDGLTREHDEIVRLISRLRTAHRDGDTARMARTARAIGRVLGPHTRDGVLPAAPALLGTEEWEAVEAEQARAGVAPSPPAGAGGREPAGPPR
ncbi:hypothetical protein [Streptomyces sp. NPDC055058]